MYIVIPCVGVALMCYSRYRVHNRMMNALITEDYATAEKLQHHCLISKSAVIADCISQGVTGVLEVYTDFQTITMMVRYSPDMEFIRQCDRTHPGVFNRATVIHCAGICETRYGVWNDIERQSTQDYDKISTLTQMITDGVDDCIILCYHNTHRKVWWSDDEYQFITQLENVGNTQLIPAIKAQSMIMY